MKDRYTDAIQNRFTAYLQAAIANRKESLQRRLLSRIRAIKVIWILKSNITATRWNSRHLS